MPQATIQVDVDSYEDILAGHDYRRNKDLGFKTIYQTAIPRFLELFDKHGIKATFFVVGRDAAVPENQEVLRELAKGGHELANHTMQHFLRPPFCTLPQSRQEDEIVRGEEAIVAATGVSQWASKLRPFPSPMAGFLVWRRSTKE